MAGVVDRHPATRGLIAMLTTVTGRPIGDQDRPFNDTEPATYPYGIVQVLYDAQRWPDAQAPDSTVEYVWQVTCIGQRRDQADAFADRCRRAILARSPGTAGSVPAGFVNAIDCAVSVDEAAAGMVAGTVINRRLDVSAGTEREGSLFNAIDRYALMLAPA